MADTHAESEPPRHPARKWVVATVVMTAVAIGLGIWAFTLRSDVEDKDAQIASQQQQIEEQGDVAGQVREAASGFTEDVEQNFAALQDQLEQVQGAADATQEETQAAIEQAEQAATEASDRVAAAEDEAERARAEADEVTAQAEAAGACVRGYLSSIAGIFDAESISAGVDGATAEFEALNASCADVLGSG
jgi:chromosome segregation ATPase